MVKKIKKKAKSQKKKTFKGLRILLIVIACIFVISLIGITFSMITKNEFKETFGIIIGSGNVISETREVPYFNSLELRSISNVYISQGEKQSITIQAEDNILETINTEVKNNKLIISKEGYRFAIIRAHAPINIYITTKDITELEVSGSGNIISNSIIVTDNLELEISGSGNITINASTNNLETSISGSGKIDLSGIANNHNLKISGSGNINSFNLLTKSTSALISGSGNAKINVLEELDAKISGSGNIQYQGNPEVETSISGSGTVKKG